MNKIYQMGSVILALRDFPIYDKWPFRDWKLDPYTIESGVPDITVCYGKAPTDQDRSLVWQTSTLYAQRQIYILDDGGVLWQQIETVTGRIELQFYVQKDWKTIIVVSDETQTCGMAVFEALTFFIFFAMLKKVILTFHGALLEHNGKGILLVGESGVGKSTHARLWRNYKNALIINGDRGTCYQKDGRWIGFGTPWCGTSGEYVNREIPIQVVVILRQGMKNSVVPLLGIEMLQEVIPHMICPEWDLCMKEEVLNLLNSFLDCVPVVSLECTPDERAVDTLQQYLEKEL